MIFQNEPFETSQLLFLRHRLQLGYVSPEAYQCITSTDMHAEAQMAQLFDEHVEHAVEQTDFEPSTMAAALRSDQAPSWISAYTDEVAGLEKDTFDQPIARDQVPAGSTIVKTKMVHKLKRDEHGRVCRYKARLTARGDLCVEDIDYTETFSP